MKSVYVDDALHRTLKRLAQENQQTLLSLLDRFGTRTWYILLKLETEQLHAPKTFWEVYRKEPDRFKPILRKLRAFTKRLEQLPHISFIETEAGSYETALKTVDRHPLLPRDAYQWSIMQDHEVSIIATTDTDFARIPDVTIYTCNEKMLAA